MGFREFTGELDQPTAVKEFSGELDKPKEEQKSEPYPIPYFRGISYVQPPSERSQQFAVGAIRGALADVAASPFQMVAGLADVGNDLARRAGLPGTSDASMSESVSRYRNILAGRPGTAPGRGTGLVQGIATAPLNPLLQLGLFPGLREPDQNPTVELGKGAAVSLPLMGLARAMSPSRVQSVADKRLRDTASKEGIDMLAGTSSGQKGMKEIESRAERSLWLGGSFGGINYAQRTREAIDDQFTKALWRHAGMPEEAALPSGQLLRFNEVTPKHLNYAFEKVGNKLDEPFKGKTMDFRSPNLNLVVKQAQAQNKTAIEPELVDKAIGAINARIQKGNITTSDFNTLMEDLRTLSSKAFETEKNFGAGRMISELARAAREQAVRNIPTQSGKREYLDAVKQYANLKVIEDVFARSKDSARGNIDPEKIKAALQRSMEGGYARGRADLSDLAALGEAMRPSSALPEGVRMNPMDPSIYMMMNNPLSLAMRKYNPVNYETASPILRSLGIWAGQ